MLLPEYESNASSRNFVLTKEKGTIKMCKVCVVSQMKVCVWGCIYAFEHTTYATDYLFSALGRCIIS